MLPTDSLFRLLIQKALLILIGLVLLFGGVIYGLSNYYTTLDERNQVVNSQLYNLWKQVRFLRTQESLTQKYGKKYQAFLRSGLVFQQNRVKWADELLKVKKQLHLFPFNFEFEAERPLDRKDIKYLRMDKNIFYYTSLHLSMGLTSDMDLLKVLDQIRDKITPLFLVRGCSMEVTNEALKKPKFEPHKALINAKCTLILFQARLKKFKLD